MTTPMVQEYNQFDRFRNSLPRVCACTNELGVTLYRMKSSAELMRYIGPNHLNSINYVPLDLDMSEAVLAWEDANVPPPNIATINPDNGHAHYLYGLASPVQFNPDSNRRPQRYLAAVEYALGRKLGADLGYSGNLTKNPLNPHWPTFCFSDVAYDLDNLASHLELEPRHLDLRRKMPSLGLGRNCTLFDDLRRIAYKERQKPDQGWFSLDMFIFYLEGIAQGMNYGFQIPLTEREVHHIAKSVGTWTWENMSPEGFKLWGDNRRAKSIRTRHARKEDRAERIRDLARAFPGATAQAIADMVGLSRRTVFYALKSGTT